MHKKIPLQLSGALRRTLAPATIVHWMMGALMLGLLALGVVLFYLLSLDWFRNEFSRAVVELTQKAALRRSHTIIDSLSRVMATGRFPPGDEERIANFLRENPTVVGIIIAQGGRIVSVTIAPGAATGPILQNQDEPGRSLVGFDEEALLGILAAEEPNLLQVRDLIRYANRPVGSLTLLVDRTITQDALNLAINRMTGRLTMLLGGVVMVLALAALLIRRQQQLAQRLLERRSEVDRLAYVGTLAAGLAHEIRNPLNALAMQLELLEEDIGDGSPQLVAPRLKHIRRGLGGVERTVHDFLTYATPGKQRPQTIELASVIGTVCEEVAQGTPDLEVRMESIVAPGLMAWCDSHALRQILSNLISNALRAQRGRDEVGHVRIEANRNGNWIDILVDDAGCGVPADQRSRVFDCFFTTQSEGTGLGLPIARRLAEMNGGQLTLVPEPSPLGGARFRLRLSARPLPLAID